LKGKHKGIFRDLKDQDPAGSFNGDQK